MNIYFASYWLMELKGVKGRRGGNCIAIQLL